MLWRHNTAYCILHRRTHFRCPNIVLKLHVDWCYSLIYLQYRKSAFWLYITDHGNFIFYIALHSFYHSLVNKDEYIYNFGVAHALYHVTLSPGVKNNHSYEIFDPYLPIHYATFMRLRWRLRARCRNTRLSRPFPSYCSLIGWGVRC